MSVENNIQTEITIHNKIENIDQFPGKWFVVSCYSGNGEKVAKNLRNKITTGKWDNLIFDVRVILENIKSKKTKKVEQKNLYPGYIFVNMLMDNQAWYIVRNTDGVTGFIGSSGRGTKPFPLPRVEARKILEKITRHVETESKKIYFADFEVGDYITVSETAFDGQEGQVMALDNTKGFATVKLEVFGRYTPTQIPFENCKKINT